MSSIFTYWQEVRSQEAQLPDGEVLWIVSVEDPARCLKGGVVAEVDRRGAAIRLVERTHRLAAPEEVEAHRKRLTILGAPIVAAMNNYRTLVLIKKKEGEGGK